MAIRINRSPCVIWITGLSGSGKTTLAFEVTRRLREQDAGVILLDGDELRAVFGAAASSVENHGREGRLQLAFQYSHLCRVLAEQGFIVVIATISMFKEIHVWNRTNLPGYFEVFLKVPVEELIRRDPKGIYKRYSSGEVENVAGLDLVVDEPEAADLLINFSDGQTVEQLADELMKNIRNEKFL